MVQLIKDGVALGSLSHANAKTALRLINGASSMKVVAQTQTTICIETV
jgi:hypothetical protein